jgi:hypothetical protein
MRSFISSVLLALASWYVQQHLFQTIKDADLGRTQQMHPPLMDTVTVTAMLYRFASAFNL